MDTVGFLKTNRSTQGSLLACWRQIRGSSISHTFLCDSHYAIREEMAQWVRPFALVEATHGHA